MTADDDFDNVLARAGVPNLERVREISFVAWTCEEFIAEGNFEAAWGALQFVATKALDELKHADGESVIEFYPQADFFVRQLLEYEAGDVDSRNEC